MIKLAINMTEKRNNVLYEDYNICRSYDKVLSNEYKNFSPNFFSTERNKKITILVRYFVEEILKITPEQAVFEVDYKKLSDAKLKCLLKYIKMHKPIEFENDDKYVSHLIYFAYPELKKPNKQEMIINCYKEVLSRKRKNFPKNYFKCRYGEERAKICFEYLWKNVLQIQYDDIPKVFLETNEKGLDILSEYRLKILIQTLYYSVFDMVRDMYPDLTMKSIISS